MKTYNKILSTLAIGSLSLASCVDLDTFPQSGTFTSDQKQEVVSADPELLAAEVTGMYANNLQQFPVFGSQGRGDDFGYPAVCLSNDLNGPDMVGPNSGYNWFSVSYDYSDRQYNYIVCYLRYSFFYNQIKLCNDVLAPFAGMDYSAQAAESRHAIGQALAVRAFDYLGLAPYYQFRYADSKDLPCVPIVSETMTQEEYTDNPRASVETVYKKIIGDLTTAIELLADYSRGSDKTKVDRQVAYGLRARAYLSMGMYAEAAADAEMAMDGYTPYSMTEVGRPAFCNLTDHNWMWGILQESDQQGGLISWPSHLGSFTAVGYTTGTGVYKRINPLLYDKISDTDVRKGWWTNDRNTSPLLDEIEWNGVTGAAIATLEIPDVKVAFQNYTVVKFGMKSGIGSTEGNIDLGLDIFCLIDQFHQFPDENISFLVHQVESLPGKGQGILCQYQVSFGRKGIRIHIIISLSGNISGILSFFVRSIVFIQDLCIDSVQFFLGDHAQQFPAQIQSFCNAPVLIRTLSYKFMFKSLSEFQIDFIYRRKLVFSDNRRQSSGIAYFCIAGKELVGYILVIFSCKAFSDTILHKTGKGRKYIDRRINGLAVKLPFQNDLALCNIPCQVRDGVSDIVIGHGKDRNLGNRSCPSPDNAGSFVQSGKFTVQISRITFSGGNLTL